MSETSGEVKSLKGKKRNMVMDYYFGGRDSNPWPTPPKQSGGAFGVSSAKSSEQPTKKFGGGFGGSAKFGSLIGRIGGGRIGGGGTDTDHETIRSFPRTYFNQPKEPTRVNVSRDGFGVFGAVSSPSRGLLTPEPSISLMDIKNEDRCVTPKPSENVHTVSNATRRGGFGNSPRSSEVMSPSKRSRTGRRTGRRGPRGPGHCFHCQEHGHISRACPKKAADTDDFEDGGGDAEANRFVEDEKVNGQKQITVSSLAAQDEPYLNAKLENQKARDSYYAGYGYGKTTGTGGSSLLNSSNTGFESGRSSAVGGDVGRSIKSPEVDKFSEQLDNALKLHVAESPVPSPRGLTLVGKGGAGENAESRISSHKAEIGQTKSNGLLVKDPVQEMSSEVLTIETRRIVKREGECYLEETTIINFPRVLPSNVRVITAQFFPVTSPQGV